MLSGPAWGWGNWDGIASVNSTDAGVFGTGTPGGYAIPTQSLLTSVSRVSTNGVTSLFLATDATAYVSGANNIGQLGQGTTDILAHATPSLVPGLIGIADIGISANGTCYALDGTGVLWGWGYNADGQLGLGDTTARLSPTQILTNVAYFAAGNNHTLVLTTGGASQATGDNSVGQFGIGNFNSSTSWVSAGGSLSGIAQVFAAVRDSFWLLATGDVYASGRNASGEFGSSSTSISTPFLVPGISNVIQVAGGSKTVYLTSLGIGYEWGTANHGGLGDGSVMTPTGSFSQFYVPPSAPVQVVMPIGVTITKLATGIDAGSPALSGSTQEGNGWAAIGSDGNLYIWGAGLASQMGNGSQQENNSTPQAVPGFPHVIDCSWAGWEGILAIGPAGLARSYAQIIGF